MISIFPLVPLTWLTWRAWLNLLNLMPLPSIYAKSGNCGEFCTSANAQTQLF
jgi:hypothetical protein